MKGIQMPWDEYLVNSKEIKSKFPDCDILLKRLLLLGLQYLLGK